jgi:hypothetical protein
MMVGLFRFATLAVLLLSAPATFAAAGAAGDLWQVTSKMSMAGMPMAMPAQVSKVCAATTWTQPPGGMRGACTRTDFHVDGSTATWTETCENPPMTGHGEITRQGGDAYTGSIRFTSPQGDMTITLDGRRIGACEVDTAHE